MSFVSADGSTWKDITLENRTVCLKVYTVADDSKITANKDISVDYNGGKYFSVKVVTADGRIVVGSSVKFVFNGKTTTVNTDSNGIAKINKSITSNVQRILVPLDSFSNSLQYSKYFLPR